MTMPKIAEMVQRLIPHWRNRLTPAEQYLAPHLRGNEQLFNALTGLIAERVRGRENVPPSNPTLCMELIVRDRELQWLLRRLDFVYRSPVNPTAQDGSEHPDTGR